MKEIKAEKYLQCDNYETSAAKWPKETALSDKHTLLFPFKTHYSIGGVVSADNFLF